MPPHGQNKIGFIGSSAPSSPHHDSFRAFIPEDIEFTFVQEAGEKSSLYDARGKVEPLIGQVQRLITEQRWDGVIISGAPKEALNPGMWEQVSAALECSHRFGAALVGRRSQSFLRQADPADDAGRRPAQKNV